MAKEVDLITIPEEAPAYKRISWWIEHTFVRVVKRVINGVSTQIRQMLSLGVTDFVEDFEQDLIPIIKPFVDEILSVPNLPSYFRTMLEDAISGKSQAGMMILGSVAGMASGVAGGGIIGPFSRKLEQIVEWMVRSRMLDDGAVLELYRRGLITEEEAKNVMRYTGLDDAATKHILALKVPLMDDSTLTQLMWRGDFSSENVSTELRKRGMNEAQILLWKKVRQVIPSPNELISIAVREGFNDSVARQFGYDEDYPTVAAEWAKKQGMQETFFKAAWRAHWNLPGLVQVREMYHRGIINEDDLMVYLKAADLPIFWRNAIVKWMDRVVTRVDARRMYDLGIWDEARVFAHHKELGYNDDDAGDMTMWVALNYMSDDRDLTKSDVLTMYQDGILNESEATTYLTALDYKQSAISLMLAHRDLKREEAYERQIISNVQALFVGGLYDRTDVFAKLGKISTPDAVIKQSLAVWDLEKERKVAVPSTTQLRDMVLENVITVDTFISEMRNKKYPDKYINWYVALWLGD